MVGHWKAVDSVAHENEVHAEVFVRRDQEEFPKYSEGLIEDHFGRGGLKSFLGSCA